MDPERDAAEIYSLIAFSEKENSILKKAPQIAKMWHPTKNGRVTPEDISVGSSKKFWWQGDCGHEWMSTVSYEISSGKCPYCSGMRVLQGFNDLATVNPQLQKNGIMKRMMNYPRRKLLPEAVKKYGGDVKKVISGMLPLFQEIEEMVALSVQIVLL